MSKQLWKYLRSRVQVVTNCDKTMVGTPLLIIMVKYVGFFLILFMIL